YHPPLISTCTSYKPGSCGGSTTRHPDSSATSGTPPGSAPPAPAGPPPRPTGTSWAPGRPTATNRTVPPVPALTVPLSPATPSRHAPHRRQHPRPPQPAPAGLDPGPAAPRPVSCPRGGLLSRLTAAGDDPRGPFLPPPTRHSSSSSFRSAGIAETAGTVPSPR